MFGDDIRRVIPFWGTTVARVSCTGFILLPTWLAYPWWKCSIAWLLLYMGFIFGWKAWQSMDNLPKDILSMGIRGLVLTAPVGMVLDNIALALCGSSMGIIYCVGKLFPLGVELDGSPTDNVTFGEYMFGAVLGMFIGLSVR
jgi:hypothetical protein